MSETTNDMPAKKKRLSATTWQLAFTVVLAAAMTLSFTLNVLAPREQSEPPQGLVGLQISGTANGQEAVDRIDRLLGLNVKLTNAYVVEYARGDEWVTVWVGVAGSRSAADDLLDSILKALGRSDSAFGEPQVQSIAGHEVLQVDGPSGQHFFYHSRESVDQIIWLTAGAAGTESIVADALRSF